MTLRSILAVGGVLTLGACLSAVVQPKRFYVLHGEPRSPVAEIPVIRGLVRVRTLDTDRVYEKFQIVVRRSPYQLGYSDENVWAVKPNEAIADLVSSALEHSATFSAVTRELLDTRPQFVVSGTLHAAEVYDSDDLWFAHLGFSLHLSQFLDGERIWSFDFDERKEVNRDDFGHAVRALSELLDGALTKVIHEMSALDIAQIMPGAKPPPAALPAPEPASKPAFRPAVPISESRPSEDAPAPEKYDGDPDDVVYVREDSEANAPP